MVQKTELNHTSMDDFLSQTERGDLDLQNFPGVSLFLSIEEVKVLKLKITLEMLRSFTVKTLKK